MNGTEQEPVGSFSSLHATHRNDVDPGSRVLSLSVWFGVVTVAALVVASGGVATWSVFRAVDDPRPDSADALVVFAGESARVQLALQLSHDLGSDGVAPVVVFPYGLDNPLVVDRCGQLRPVEVLCPAPESSNTRGEAQMFADLARERGWRTVVAVTGDYHLARARTLLTRCVGDSVKVAFVTVDWDAVAIRVYLHEVVGLGLTYTIGRGC